jgi:hypothetical protein
MTNLIFYYNPNQTVSLYSVGRIPVLALEKRAKSLISFFPIL